jgi:putative hydrolase of HD superfamily
MDNKVLIDFLMYSERLKTEYRHAHKSDGKLESTADHSWRLALMLILIAPKLSKPLDIEKALKMAIIHDIVEIEAKDVPILEHIGNDNRKALKNFEEEKAIQNIHKLLGCDGDEIHGLWDEFESGDTYEAKVVGVLDKIEGQMQFLSENNKRFSIKEQIPVKKLIDKTTELSYIDPYIERLYQDCGEMFRKRTML